MKIEVIRSYPTCWATLLISEEYVIECSFTIWGSTRVSLREVGNFGLMCNWCAGATEFNTIVLINTLLGYIEKEKELEVPFCSDERPCNRDDAFMRRILPYFETIYFKTIADLLPTAETIKTASQIDYETTTKKEYPYLR